VSVGLVVVGSGDGIAYCSSGWSMCLETEMLNVSRIDEHFELLF
jgi:hypothetical protein